LIKEDVDDLPQWQAWRTAVRVRALQRLAQTPAQAPRGLRIAVLAALLALHAALFMAWYASRDHAPAPHDAVVQVRLLDARSALPPPILPRPRRHAPTASAPVAPPAMAQTSRTAPSPGAPSIPELFNGDGSIRLPPAPAPTPLQAGLARARELLARGHNIIHCRRSRFDNGPTPEQAGIAAGKSARMAQLIMGNPLDPLGEVGATQQVDSARELAAAKRAIEQQACDY
jgi:hypothetical protein